jgi:hypothetical protein
MWMETTMSTERELTIDELSAVSSAALNYIETRFPVAGGGGGGGGGDAGPAIAAWNTLLKQYGAARCHAVVMRSLSAGLIEQISGASEQIPERAQTYLKDIGLIDVGYVSPWFSHSRLRP